MKTLAEVMTVALAAALLVVGCGGAQHTRYDVAGRDLAPGANARIDVRHTPAGNRRVDLDVQWLPPPERLGPGLSAYTVWIVPPYERPIPAGRLEYDPASRRGRLTLVTPYTDFRIIIAAEAPGEALAYPSEHVVVERDVAT